VTQATLARAAAFLLAGAMLAIGLASWLAERRRGRDAEGFWTAHRSISGWSLGMSLSASMLSVSWSLVYGVELLYRWGPGGVWLLAVPWLAVLALFALLVPRLRRFGAFSQGELFGAVYGAGLRRLTVAVLVAVFLAWCGAEIAAAGELLAPLVGSSPRLAMTAIAVLVASYTWTGGFRSVVATDVAQFVIIVAFLLVMGQRAATGPGPGWSGWLHIAGPSASVVGITLLAYVTGWLAEADIWLRLTAAPSDRQARLALLVTAIASLVFVLALPAMLAARARVAFPDPSSVKGTVLGALLHELMPRSLEIVLLGGLAAVALSTVSTTANVVAVTVARDGLRPSGNARRDLARARWASALAVFGALVVAFASRSLAELFYLSSGLLAAVLFWPTLGLLWQDVPRRAATTAAWAGQVAVLVSFLADRRGLLARWTPPAVSAMGIAYIVPGVLVGALTFALALLFAPAGPSSQGPPSAGTGASIPERLDAH
jgi:solute:Na+ symporter, SSS family